MIERCLVSKPDAADGSWLAESNTRPAREKQGGLIMPCLHFTIAATARRTTPLPGLFHYWHSLKSPSL